MRILTLLILALSTLLVGTTFASALENSSKWRLRLRQANLGYNKKYSSSAIRPRMGYQLSNDSVVYVFPNIQSEFYNNDKSREDRDVKITYWGARYDIFNILTEEENGIRLNSRLRYQSYFNTRDRELNNEEGRAGVRLIFNKKISSNWSLESKDKFNWMQTSPALFKDKKAQAAKDVSLYDFSLKSIHTLSSNWSTTLEAYSTQTRKYTGYHTSNLRVGPGIKYYFSDAVSTEAKVLSIMAQSGDNQFLAKGNLGAEYSVNWLITKDVFMRFKTKSQLIDTKTGQWWSRKALSDNLSAKLLFNISVM